MWFDCLIGCLLNLLIFGGPVAIGAIFSIGAIAQYIAFILPVAIRVIFVRDNFRAGPWNLGKFSRPCGFIALGWVCLIAPVLCFPAVNDPTPMLMNWTCLVYGGPMFMALVWYAVDARKWFKGPKVSTPLSYLLSALGQCRTSDDKSTCPYGCCPVAERDRLSGQRIVPREGGQERNIHRHYPSTNSITYVTNASIERL